MYNTKHAATLIVALRGERIDTIRGTTGWLENLNVFAQFRNRSIVSDQTKLARIVSKYLQVLNLKDKA